MKILSSDYDDTLFIDQHITQENIEAIKRFQKQGNLFGINSGRHLDSIFAECDMFGLTPDFYIGNNGTVVLNKDREILFIADFNPEVVQEVIEYFREHLSEKVYFISVNNGYDFGREFFNEGCDFLPEHTKDMNPFINNPISTMFSQAIQYEDTMPLVRQIKEYFGDRIFVYGNAPFIDIVNHEIDKASGLEKVAEYYQIKHENIFSIGDSYNDIAMLSRYHGFVMSHAKDSVKSFAKDEVDAVHEAINKILVDNVK